MRGMLAGLAVAAIGASALAGQNAKGPGVVLGELSWQEAERLLSPSAVVVLPLGLGSVQHGPHLKLDNDERLARYLAGRVHDAADVVIAPALTYHFSPTFLEYPGSASLSQSTARDMTVEAVRSLAKYGPRRFYILNTGITTMSPLKNAAEVLADDGILLGYTDVKYHLDNARVARQQTPMRGAAHADEIETSIMLFVDPSAVDMRKAVREYGPGSGPMTRQKDAPGTYSASGVVGDPTVATREKGQVLVEALVAGALDDIEMIRNAKLPTARSTTTTPAAPPPAQRPQPPRLGEQALPNGCLPSDERAIRAVGERFSYLWRQMDAEKLAELFSPNGDMRHPDGTIEKGQVVIRDNRQELFNKREYHGSVHSVMLNDIRCLGSVAIADGKWELRLEDSPTSGAPARNLGPGRRHSGWCTLVLRGEAGAWSIEAWRYTVNPPDGSQAPTTLKQPGFIGRGGH